MTCRLPRQLPGTERNVHKRMVALAAGGARMRPSFLPLLLSLLL